MHSSMARSTPRATSARIPSSESSWMRSATNRGILRQVPDAVHPRCRLKETTGMEHLGTVGSSLLGRGKDDGVDDVNHAVRALDVGLHDLRGAVEGEGLVLH